jgi:hypothetical protein
LLSGDASKLARLSGSDSLEQQDFADSLLEMCRSFGEPAGASQLRPADLGAAVSIGAADTRVGLIPDDLPDPTFLDELTTVRGKAGQLQTRGPLLGQRGRVCGLRENPRDRV